MILLTRMFPGSVSGWHKPAYAELGPRYPYFSIIFKLFFNIKGEKMLMP